VDVSPAYSIGQAKTPLSSPIGGCVHWWRIVGAPGLFRAAMAGFLRGVGNVRTDGGDRQRRASRRNSAIPRPYQTDSTGAASQSKDPAVCGSASYDAEREHLALELPSRSRPPTTSTYRHHPKPGWTSAPALGDGTLVLRNALELWRANHRCAICGRTVFSRSSLRAVASPSRPAAPAMSGFCRVIMNVNSPCG